MNLPTQISPSAAPAFSPPSSLRRFRFGLVPALLLVLVAAPRPRAADSFADTDWATVESGGMNLVYQGSPPSFDSEASSLYPGSPCNWVSTGQIATLAAGTTGWTGTGIMYFLWSNRWDNTASGTNRRANPISPAIERSQPLDWEADAAYAVGEVVYEVYGTGTHWWRCVAATSGASSFTPGTTWVQIDPGCESVYVPQCRIEYSTLANAIAANVVQTRWLAGRPDHADDGSGYLDALGYNSATLSAAYTHDDLATDADTIFDTRAALASTGYAVARDIVYLPPQRLTDAWTDYAPGTTWTTGDLVRDQGNLLPNNFTHYTSAEYTDASTGLTPASTTKTIADGCCELTGNNKAVRHKLLLPADSGVTYELCVKGRIAVAVPYDATYNPSSLKARVRLQAFGLDTGGAETATHVEANFTSFNTTGTTFTLREKFAVSASGTDTIAWPAGATYLRFSVNTNGGFGTIATSASVLVESMTVTVAGTTPTYWRCTATSHTSPASSGTSFATFADDRAASSGAFKAQAVGVELDHEVSDLRSPSNLTATLAELHATLAEEGYVFHVYTNTLDDYLDTIGKTSTATKNGFAEGNLDDVLANCDVLTSVIYGSNQRGNDLLGVMAANYNRMAWVNGTYSGTSRTHFAAGKVGFALELPERGAASSRPIRDLTLETDGTIKVHSVAGNGASADGYVSLGGLSGSLGTAFNGHVFRVKSGGTDFKIDAMVTGVNANTGAVSTTSLPTLSTYAGGGYFETSGWSVADFAAVRTNYFTGKGVVNYNLWRSGAAQKQAAPDAAIAITGITVTTDTPHQVILKTGTAIAWDRVYVANLTGSWAILNGASYAVDRGAADECPPPTSSYSGTEFLLTGYNGDLFTPGDYTVTSGDGDVTNAMDRNVNAKISALANLP